MTLPTQPWKPLNVTWSLLRERAAERNDGRTKKRRLNEIECYKEEGYSAARCGLETGLVGYEELNDEEAYEREMRTKDKA